MIKVRILVIVVVGTALFAGATAFAAASWYWRGGQYVLPGYNQKAALQDILTEHRNDLDALGVQQAANTAAIATNAANIATNTGNIATNTAAITGHVNDTGNAHSHDLRYVRNSGQATRSLFGTIDGAAGTILTGSGFALTKNGVGDYTITYDTAFPTSPSVQFVAGHGGLTFNVTPTSARLFVFDNAANPQDSGVMLTITGAQ